MAYEKAAADEQSIGLLSRDRSTTLETTSHGSPASLFTPSTAGLQSSGSQIHPLPSHEIEPSLMSETLGPNEALSEERDATAGPLDASAPVPGSDELPPRSPTPQPFGSTAARRASTHMVKRKPVPQPLELADGEYLFEPPPLPPRPPPPIPAQRVSRVARVAFDDSDAIALLDRTSTLTTDTDSYFETADSRASDRDITALPPRSRSVFNLANPFKSKEPAANQSGEAAPKGGLRKLLSGRAFRKPFTTRAKRSKSEPNRLSSSHPDGTRSHMDLNARQAPDDEGDVNNFKRTQSARDLRIPKTQEVRTPAKALQLKGSLTGRQIGRKVGNFFSLRRKQGNTVRDERLIQEERQNDESPTGDGDAAAAMVDDDHIPSDDNGATGAVEDDRVSNDGKGTASMMDNDRVSNDSHPMVPVLHSKEHPYEHVAHPRLGVMEGGVPPGAGTHVDLPASSRINLKDALAECEDDNPRVRAQARRAMLTRMGFNPLRMNPAMEEPAGSSKQESGEKSDQESGNSEGKGDEASSKKSEVVRETATDEGESEGLPEPDGRSTPRFGAYDMSNRQGKANWDEFFP